jgi:MFS family permease
MLKLTVETSHADDFSSAAKFGCAVVFVGAINFGFVLVVVNGTVSPVAAEFALNTAMQSLVVSIVIVGAMAGCLGGGFLVDVLGRRAGLLVSSACYVLGALIMAWSPSIAVLLAGRLVAGAGVGLCGLVSPIYLTEIAPLPLRGRLVITFELVVCCGVMLALLVNLLVPGHQWRLQLGGSAVPGVLALCLAGWAPETEAWKTQLLALTPSSARRPPASFAASVADLSERVALRQQAPSVVSSDHLASASWTPSVPSVLSVPALAAAAMPARVPLREALGVPALRRKLLLTLGLLAAHNAMAAFALQARRRGAPASRLACPSHECSRARRAQGFATEILGQAGVPQPLLCSMLVGVMKLLGVVLCVACEHRFSRRAMLLAGALGMGSCHALVSLGFALACPPLVVAPLSMLFFFWNASWAPLIWTVAAELLPASIRAPAMGVATIFFWSTSFLVTQLVLSMIEALTAPGAFATFALGAAVAAAFVELLLPETKDTLRTEARAIASALSLAASASAGVRHPRSPAKKRASRASAPSPGVGSPLGKLPRVDSAASVDSEADEWRQIQADGRVAVEWARLRTVGDGSEPGSSGSSPLGML